MNPAYPPQNYYYPPMSHQPSGGASNSNRPATTAAAAPEMHAVQTAGAPQAQPEVQAEPLKPLVGEQNGWTYRLYIAQQPQRARMCGFGDKDRRPITPPPCVRLVITDKKTGKEIDCNEIDHAMYVLNVDLWSEDGVKEVNLVRHTSATPSISSTTPASFAQIDEATPAFSPFLPSNRDMPQYPGAPGYSPSVTPYAQGGYTPQAIPPVAPPPYGMVGNGFGGQAAPYYPGQADVHGGMNSQAMAPYGLPRMFNGTPDMPVQHHRMTLSHQPQGMFTRNLIGSLSASAFRLQDPQDKIGIWFVLQDLSVRTEGTFRLRFSFVNVGVPPRPSNGAPSGQGVNTGKAPILASCFSDAFQVYSAKKFPGVCESTPLSKCFANQGIKIPIRKEGGKGNDGGDDDDD